MCICCSHERILVFLPYQQVLKDSKCKNVKCNDSHKHKYEHYEIAEPLQGTEPPLFRRIVDVEHIPVLLEPIEQGQPQQCEECAQNE